MRGPPRSTLFPYPTLFRSGQSVGSRSEEALSPRTNDQLGRRRAPAPTKGLDRALETRRADHKIESARSYELDVVAGPPNDLSEQLVVQHAANACNSPEGDRGVTSGLGETGSRRRSEE